MTNRKINTRAIVSIGSLFVISIIFVLVAFYVSVHAQTEESLPRLSSDRLVLETIAGDIVIAFYPDVAPQHVERIRALAAAGRYDGVPFIRLIPDFIAQVGDVAEHKTLKPLGLEIDLTSPLKHTRGRLSMAKFKEPVSAYSSFSIIVKDSPHLDNRYSIFGEVVAGLDVVDSLVTARTNEKKRPTVEVKILRARILDTAAAATYVPRQAVALPASLTSLAPKANLASPARTAANSATFSEALIINLALAFLGTLIALYSSIQNHPRVVRVVLILIAFDLGVALLQIFFQAPPVKNSLAGVFAFVMTLACLKSVNYFESPQHVTRQTPRPAKESQ